MNKIYGETKTIEAAKNAKPGDKTVLINWDAINELPNQYEVIISEVKFDLKNDFSDVGNGNYMPSPALHYKIAEAKGISGGDNSIIEAIYEDVNINDMNCVDTPLFQKIVVGYRCRKFSTVMEEDGTIRKSSVCTIDYNVWNRVSEWWANEEKATKGYSTVIDGEFTAYNKKKKGLHYMKEYNGKSYATETKYQTKWDRKSCFFGELKFAMQKAETKAHEKTIRELAGLMTGYRAEDLTLGRLIFAKVRRSREILQAESAAHLSAISQGRGEPIDLLFGKTDTIPEFKGVTGAGTAPKSIIKETVSPEPVKSPKQIFMNVIDKYKSNIDENLVDRTEDLMKWLEKEEAPEKNENWRHALAHLKKIEESIPEEYRVKHGL